MIGGSKILRLKIGFGLLHIADAVTQGEPVGTGENDGAGTDRDGGGIRASGDLRQRRAGIGDNVARTFVAGERAIERVKSGGTLQIVGEPDCEGTRTLLLNA